MDPTLQQVQMNVFQADIANQQEQNGMMRIFSPHQYQLLENEKTFSLHNNWKNVSKCMIICGSISIILWFLLIIMCIIFIFAANDPSLSIQITKFFIFFFLIAISIFVFCIKWYGPRTFSAKFIIFNENDNYVKLLTEWELYENGYTLKKLGNFNQLKGIKTTFYCKEWNEMDVNYCTKLIFGDNQVIIRRVSESVHNKTYENLLKQFEQWMNTNYPNIIFQNQLIKSVK